MMTVRTSPHIHGSLRTDKAMLMVVIALLPAALWGVWSFGLRALFVLIVSIAGAFLTEYLLGKVSKEFTLRDGSALVTGLLVGMNMPPLEFHQFYIPLIASAFAIGVVKWTFGGLGCNWMNPALAGRVFVFFSFTSQMSTFRTPRVFLSDAVTSATPLSAMKTAMSAGGAGRSSDLLTLPVTDFAASLSDKLGISPYAVDAFFGNVGGCIGEVSALLLLAGGIFLLCMKIITWRIPVVWPWSFPWRDPPSCILRWSDARCILYGYRLGNDPDNAKGRDNLRIRLWILHIPHQVLRSASGGRIACDHPDEYHHTYDREIREDEAFRLCEA